MISSRRKPLAALLLWAAAMPALAGGRDDALDRVRSAIAQSDGIAAEAAARQALDAGAPRSSVAAYMGEAFILQGDERKALAWLDPAEFDEASAERGWRALGRLRVERGEFGAAAEAFNRVIALGRQSSGLWVDIAHMRYRSGEQHIVGDAVNRALSLDPGDPAALSLRAQLVRDSGGLAASIPWFERAVEKVPNNVDLLADYAATLGELGRYRDMLEVVRRMAEIDSGHPQIYFLQSVLAARAGRDNLARRLLWRAKDDFTATPAGLLLTGVLDYRTGHPALAAESFSRLLRMQPDNGTAERLLARALLAAGDSTEVVARLSPLAAREGASAYVLVTLARALEQLGRRAEAAPLLDRAARASAGQLAPYPLDADQEAFVRRWKDDPARPAAAVLRLRHLLGEGSFAEARAYAQVLKNRYPGASDIEMLAGDTALVSGDPAAALTAYGAAGEVRRTSAMMRRVILAQRNLGDSSLANRTLAAALALDPQDRELAIQLGRLRASQGHWREAALLLGHAARLGGAHDPRLLTDLSEARFESGDVPGALAAAQRAYRVQPMRPEVARALARALRAQGLDGHRQLLARAGGEGRLAMTAGR